MWAATAEAVAGENFEQDQRRKNTNKAWKKWQWQTCWGKFKNFCLFLIRNVETCMFFFFYFHQRAEFEEGLCQPFVSPNFFVPGSWRQHSVGTWWVLKTQQRATVPASAATSHDCSATTSKVVVHSLTFRQMLHQGGKTMFREIKSSF